MSLKSSFNTIFIFLIFSIAIANGGQGLVGSGKQSYTLDRSGIEKLRKNRLALIQSLKKGQSFKVGNQKYIHLPQMLAFNKKDYSKAQDREQLFGSVGKVVEENAEFVFVNFRSESTGVTGSSTGPNFTAQSREWSNGPVYLVAVPDQGLELMMVISTLKMEVASQLLMQKVAKDYQGQMLGYFDSLKLGMMKIPVEANFFEFAKKVSRDQRVKKVEIEVKNSVISAQ